MHFRERQRSIQLVRTNYDAATKKPKAELVGSLPRPGLAVSDEIRARLTEAEAIELEAYLARTSLQARIDRDYAAGHFGTTLGHVKDWLELADQDSARDFLEQVRKPLRALRKLTADIENKANLD
jgi:hypothetical protein